MQRSTLRLACGLAAVLLVTALAAGAVAASAAVTQEVTDGDGCEAGGEPDVAGTPTPKDVTSAAENVTACIATDEPDGRTSE